VRHHSLAGSPSHLIHKGTIKEVNEMKKITVRKTGSVRLTSAATPLYGTICIL
jgi:hypothetical protein